MKRFACLLLGGIFLAVSTLHADEPEEVYLRVFNLIEQADSLNSSGKDAAALAKYKEAQTALTDFQKSYRTWNPKVVAYRLEYVAEKIATLSEKSSAAAGGGSSGQVKLLEPGAEPRKVFRLHPKQGDKQSLSLTAKMSLDVKIGEMENPSMKLPAVKMVLDLTVKSVSASGDVAYDVAVSDASIVDDPDALPQFADAMKASLASIKGLSGTGTNSNRGLYKGMEIKGAADADPQMQHAMEQLKEAFIMAATPLPEEPVGSGGKWEAAMAIKSQGMTIDQKTTYHLTSIEDERLSIETTIAQSAANQKIQNPMMPTMKLDLTKMSGTGTAKITVDLSQVLPAEMTHEVHSDIAMSMNAGDQKQAMTMKTAMNARLESK